MKLPTLIGTLGTALLCLAHVHATDAPNEHARPLLERDAALGDLGGARSALESSGVTFALRYTQEWLGIAHGGFHGGGEYDSLTELDLDLDLEKLVHWHGATLHASGYAGVGASLSAQHIGDVSNVSNINMRNTVRLFELWIEEKLGDHFALRAGILAADSQFYDTGGDFFGSKGGTLFVNSDFGVIPTISHNIPEPAFPIAAPGVSITATPTGALTLRAAVYDGNPAPDALGDPTPGFVRGREFNDHGIDINLNSDEGALIVGEAVLTWNKPAPADGKAVAEPRRLGGILKLGGFHHTDTFTRWKTGAGVRGDTAGYILANQMLWHENDHDDQGLSAFGRVGVAPADRNLIGFVADGGLDYRGLLPGRDNDVCGLGVTTKKFSRDFSASEVLAGNPARDHETIFELTYRAQLSRWLGVQPDVQYVLHPSGLHSASNALVVGLRATIDF